MPSAEVKRFVERLEERRRTLRDEIEDDVGPVRSLTLEERGALVESVCRDAMAILEGRDDFAQALAASEPGSEAGWARWHAVVKGYQARGRH